MAPSLDFYTLLSIATRAQHVIAHAMEAAFGTALVVISLERDPEIPLDESIKPTFMEAYDKIVVPAIELMHADPEVRDDDLREFILGSIITDTIADNRGYLMARVDALIVESQERVKARDRRNAAPQN